MLRVGLTGDLGSGKSTVARLLAARGAIILSSDEMARAMMQPGQPVYAAIVDHFGPTILAPDATLDRRKLAQLAFTEGRAEELNAIVHPAVLAEQARRIEAITHTNPNAIVVVESALIFTTKHGLNNQPWSKRFDRIILVTAPEPLKIARFIARASIGRTLTPAEHATLEADAHRRLAMQTANQSHASECLIISNNSTLEHLEHQVTNIWTQLQKPQN
jgi:dephospho-CoA kinase